MATQVFDRDQQAQEYARRHLEVDEGIRSIYYLPTAAPEREIRLIEVNDAIVARDEDPIEPVDFGVAPGGSNEHRLLVADVTPDQWEEIRQRRRKLPRGWSLVRKVVYERR